jgi:hypothetical protein
MDRQLDGQTKYPDKTSFRISEGIVNDHSWHSGRNYFGKKIEFCMRIFQNSGQNNVDHIENVDRGCSVEKK